MFQLGVFLTVIGFGIVLELITKSYNYKKDLYKDIGIWLVIGTIGIGACYYDVSSPKEISVISYKEYKTDTYKNIQFKDSVYVVEEVTTTKPSRTFAVLGNSSDTTATIRLIAKGE